MEDASAPSVITKSTLVPIGVVLTTIITVISAWGYLDSRFTEIMKSLDRQDRRLETLERMSGERWTSMDMKLWVSELRRLNPKMEIPDVKTD